MRTYQIGVVGSGFMGKAHTYAYRSIPFFYGSLPVQAKMRAICSLPREAAEAAAGEYGYELATDDLTEFFESGIDIVHVCSPNDTHREIVLEAIRRGIHVYCEKPVAPDYPTAAEILQALKNAPSPIVSRVGFHSRFYPSAIRAKEIIDAGRLGEILSFKVRYFTMNRLEGSASPNALVSGAILDLAPHLTDMTRFLVGDFDELIAETHYRKPDEPHPDRSEDAFYSIVKMKNGAEGVIEASKIAQGANNDYFAEIYGEKGALKIDIENPDWLWFYDATDAPGPYGGDRGFKRIESFNRYPTRVFPSPRHSPGWLGGHLHSIYTFLCEVRDGTANGPTLSDGIYIQKVMDAMHLSALQRQWVSIEGDLP